MKILETERLVLRTIGAHDAPFYLALLNDPSYIRNIGDKGVRTELAARAYIQTGPATMQRRLGFSLYLIERKDSSVPIGICGLIKRATLPDVDIGFAFLPRFWGQGYAYESAAAVMAYADTVLGLRRLAGITSPENGSSNRLLRKLGFHFEQLTHLSADDPGTNLYGYEFRPVLTNAA
jgi:RimJ/RimL family protein N-acetyltransferase